MEAWMFYSVITRSLQITRQVITVLAINPRSSVDYSIENDCRSVEMAFVARVKISKEIKYGNILDESTERQMSVDLLNDPVE